jgi:hypothetical protein
MGRPRENTAWGNSFGAASVTLKVTPPSRHPAVTPGAEYVSFGILILDMRADRGLSSTGT